MSTPHVKARRPTKVEGHARQEGKNCAHPKSVSPTNNRVVANEGTLGEVGHECAQTTTCGSQGGTDPAIPLGQHLGGAGRDSKISNQMLKLGKGAHIV